MNDDVCICGHAGFEHYLDTEQCVSYFTASDGKRYPCGCDGFDKAPETGASQNKSEEP
jgi:hypothetical protein